MNRFSLETAVGVFVALGLLCVGYMIVNLGHVSLGGDNTYVLRARFDSVSGLKINHPVEVLGLEVGRVVAFQMDHELQVVWVTLKIDHGTKIFDDAIAAIKSAGLIGDKYVSIDPGGSGERLQPGDAITDTQAPIDIEALISKYAFGELE